MFRSVEAVIQADHPKWHKVPEPALPPNGRQRRTKHAPFETPQKPIAPNALTKSRVMTEPMSLDIPLADRISAARPTRGRGGPVRGDSNNNNTRRNTNRSSPYVSSYFST